MFKALPRTVYIQHTNKADEYTALVITPKPAKI